MAIYFLIFTFTASFDSLHPYIYFPSNPHHSYHTIYTNIHLPIIFQLFKSVAERGRWSSWFTEAYAAYKAGNIDTALIKYYLLAELGYEAAQSNVAYILEKGNAL